MYPKYPKYSPTWLSKMKAMHNIGASWFARNENFDMANECLVKIQKYQNIANAKKDTAYLLKS